MTESTTTTSKVVTPPVHPSVFASIEAKASHMAATISAFASSFSPATVTALVHAGEAEIESLCPALTPYMPQILQVMGDIPLLQQLAAELKTVEAIEVTPTPA